MISAEIAIGKTKEELMKAFGRPDSTNESGYMDRWSYEDKVLDPFSGKIGDVSVYFKSVNDASGVPNMIVDSISIYSN
jgi:hypothetical protein